MAKSKKEQEPEQGNGQVETTLQKIPIQLIRENPVALRPVNREKEDYLNLVDSVKKRGILNPILVRAYQNPDKPEETLYGLIDGLQRYNSALDAGLKEIPAHITQMDQATIEETQIIANAQRIETKPVQYAQQIGRLLERNPTMTISQLAARLSKSTGWIHKMLGMVRNLHDEIKPLVDDGRIKLNSAYELAKLPRDEQADWVDRAMTQEPGEFAAAVNARTKAIREARRQGKGESPAVFEPVPHQRKWAEVKAEFNNPSIGPALVKRHGVQSADEGFRLGVAWVSNMDPDSKAAQVAENEAREKSRKEKSDARALERVKAKEEEAEKTRLELEQRIKERNERAAAVSA